MIEYIDQNWFLCSMFLGVAIGLAWVIGPVIANKSKTLFVKTLCVGGVLAVTLTGVVMVVHNWKHDASFVTPFVSALVSAGLLVRLCEWSGISLTNNVVDETAETEKL